MARIGPEKGAGRPRRSSSSVAATATVFRHGVRASLFSRMMPRPDFVVPMNFFEPCGAGFPYAMIRIQSIMNH